MAENEQPENEETVQPQNGELNINAQPNSVEEQQPGMEQNTQMNGENTVKMQIIHLLKTV